MPLKVVGETGVTIQLGGIRAQDKVLVCCGLLQQVLIGIDFLTVHKCILILTLTMSTIRGDPGRWSSETLIECTLYTVHCYSISKYGRRHTCEFRGVNDLEEFIGVLQPTGKFSERYSAGPFRTAMSVKEGRIPDRVFNCLNKPRKIYTCSSIGYLYP